MNVVVPMAGRSSGFLRSKFKYPRYGIELNQVSILERSLRGIGEANYYFICLKDHYHKYDLSSLILKPFPKAQIILAEKLPQGQACSALWADCYVCNDDPLLIVSPVQVINWDPRDFFAFCDRTEADVATVACQSLSSSSEMFFIDVNKEHGTAKAFSDVNRGGWKFDCGVYYFKYGQYFSRWVREMICADNSINGEFWVAPCLNYGIVEGRKIYPYLVDDVAILRKASDVRDFAKNFPSWARP